MAYRNEQYTVPIFLVFTVIIEARERRARGVSNAVHSRRANFYPIFTVYGSHGQLQPSTITLPHFTHTNTAFPIYRPIS